MCSSYCFPGSLDFLFLVDLDFDCMVIISCMKNRLENISFRVYIPNNCDLCFNLFGLDAFSQIWGKRSPSNNSS